jgi:hypothetical protein
MMMNRIVSTACYIAVNVRVAVNDDKQEAVVTYFNPLKPCGNYMSQISYQSVTIFCSYAFCMVLTVNS